MLRSECPELPKYKKVLTLGQFYEVCGYTASNLNQWSCLAFFEFQRIKVHVRTTD